MNNEFLCFQHFQLAQKSILKLEQMIDLFYCRKFQSRIHDLVDIIYLNQMTRGWELNISYLFLTQTIFHSVCLNEDLLLLRSQFATLVDQKPKLSDPLLFIHQIIGLIILPIFSCYR